MDKGTNNDGNQRNERMNEVGSKTSKEVDKEKDKYEDMEPNHGSLSERLARVKTTRWVRFSIVSVIFVAWVAWLGSWWVLIFWPVLADIYLTQFVRWNWWKFIKDKTTRTLMSWIDAIVYALVLVYFIFLFIGQNYQIPSSSLEKSLLVGDYLWVNKMVYGPRVPNTPIHFPLAQNTMPVIGGKSYCDWPEWGYHRLAGFRSVERYDIVVFNFPAGDTVALKVQNPDYYTLCKMEPGGREAVWSNKEKYGDVIYRPVDRRENYVKRCVGLPGDWLRIKDDIVYINGKPLPEPKNIQYNYLIQTDGRQISDDVWDAIGVSRDDRLPVPITDPQDKLGVASIGFQTGGINGEVPPIYQVPLTSEMKKKIKSYPWITGIIKAPVTEMINLYPNTRNYGWTRANYGPIWIPKKGMTMLLNLNNIAKYERVIKNYEHNSLEVRDGKIYINGKQTDRYKFKMNYYWMMGDNRDNSADSRYWGFVPEDHIVGTPIFIIISFDKDKALFKGGIRWNRMFRHANPDK